MQGGGSCSKVDAGYRISDHHGRFGLAGALWAAEGPVLKLTLSLGGMYLDE